MSNIYDPSVHGKNKLGVFPRRAVPANPVVPMMPTGAQVRDNGMLHLQIGEMYLTGGIHGCVPHYADGKVKSAILAQPTEPSYSQSGSDYRHLDVKPSEDGTTCDLLAGDLILCTVIIDPTVQLMSSDESLKSQLEDDAVDGEN